MISTFRVVICPLLFAPKHCDPRLPKNENHLAKIIEVNEWIREFNNATTGLKINLDAKGVLGIPRDPGDGVQHDYNQWNEPSWFKKLHLTPEAKSSIAIEVVNVFQALSKQED